MTPDAACGARPGGDAGRPTAATAWPAWAPGDRRALFWLGSSRSPPGVMPAAALLEVAQAQRQRPRHAALVGRLCDQRAAGVRDQTVAVRRRLSREIAPIAPDPGSSASALRASATEEPLLRRTVQRLRPP